MKLECQFRNVDWSDSLVDYTRDKLEKMSKVEVKDFVVHLVVSNQKHKRCVDLTIHAFNATYKAHANSNDYYDSVDKAVKKLKTQMLKKKHKLQKHNHYSHSKEAKIERLNAELETEAFHAVRKAG